MSQGKAPIGLGLSQKNSPPKSTRPSGGETLLPEGTLR